MVQRRRRHDRLTASTSPEQFAPVGDRARPRVPRRRHRGRGVRVHDRDQARSRAAARTSGRGSDRDSRRRELAVAAPLREGAAVRQRLAHRVQQLQVLEAAAQVDPGLVAVGGLVVAARVYSSRCAWPQAAPRSRVDAELGVQRRHAALREVEVVRAEEVAVLRRASPASARGPAVSRPRRAGPEFRGAPADHLDVARAAAEMQPSMLITARSPPAAPPGARRSRPSRAGRLPRP
jgi:hypothetical protein